MSAIIRGFRFFHDDPDVSCYSVSYLYNACGDRSQVTYATPQGTKSWQYDWFENVGDPEKTSRVFQVMRALDSSGKPTAEEYHYLYDGSGRLSDCAFAQTPATGFVPASGAAFYDSTHPASTRTWAHYDYDGGGRTSNVSYSWQTWNGTTYASTPILANTCAYEVDPTGTATSNLNRGLKKSSSFYAGSGGNWSLLRTEQYGYDPKLDYLTSASYGDGLDGANPTWSYDAAGNRTDTVADNLNRPLTISGELASSDILGNRLTLGSRSYSWDALNRLVSFSGSVLTNYIYRADGMRVRKSNASGSTLYRYDGQMGFEDVTLNGAGSVTQVVDCAIGPRGVDSQAVTASGTTAVYYPLYDAHGNTMANLTIASGSYSLSNQRSYDAWGAVRQGATSGDPTGRYCANLGHKQDDESGLVYMRARYYEPGSGRFVSEDPGRHGINWFTYATGDPIGRFDATGKEDLATFLAGNSVGSSLEGIGVSTLAGDISVVDNCVLADVKLFAGTAAEGSGSLSSQAINLIRQWAMGQNISSIYIQGTTGSRLGEVAVALAVQAIREAGDNGELIRNGAFTWIYWTICGE